MILRQGLVRTGIGLALGLVLALAGCRVLQEMLFETGAADPLTFLAAGVLLAAVALLACYLPARRATRVDPAVTLRYE
jgi:putative ABC transport system permease protein